MFVIDLTAPKAGPQQINSHLAHHSHQMVWNDLVARSRAEGLERSSPSTYIPFGSNHWSYTTLSLYCRHNPTSWSWELLALWISKLNMISNILPVLEDLRYIAYNVCWFNHLGFRWSIIRRWSRVIPPTVTTVRLAVHILIIWIELDNWH